MSDEKQPVILTIDDEEFIRENFRAFLEDCDYEVLEAENGRVGLEVFEREKPDLVLVDVRMPEVDGLEVLEKVTKSSPDTPIIVVSGAGKIQDVVEALRLGAWDYLMKPVNDLSVLVHTVEKALERFKLIRENREYQENLKEKVAEQTKQIEQTYRELRKNERHYRTIIETAREGVWVVDSDARTTFVNRQLADMLGCFVEEMIGRNVTEFLFDEDVQDFVQRHEILKKGQGGQYESRFRAQDGSELWGIISTNPIFDSDGEITATFAMIMDITDRKRAEEELAGYRQHLEELVKERTQELERTHKELVEKAHKAGMADIASGIVHNVGNVLTSVKTSAQLINNVMAESLVDNLKMANELLRQNMDCLEEFILDNPKGKMLMQYYLKVEEGLVGEREQTLQLNDRLLEKVNAIADIIAAHQSYAGADSLMEESSLAKIVEDALTMKSERIEQHNIAIMKKFSEVPRVPIQKTKLLHVLINVIENAVEAMLEIPPQERKMTMVVSRDENTEAVNITVRDSGPGVQQDNLERIFAYGFTSKKGRYGLGLHSSANYMTEMGGRIWAANNADDKGLTTSLQLPISPVKTKM
ncbi:MAG: response regulator [Proteobacteria bacterium]|nr:response regulator [Pseudomonadota bacterium]